MNSGDECTIITSANIATESIALNVDVPTPVTASRTVDSNGLHFAFKPTTPLITIVDPSGSSVLNHEFGGNLVAIDTAKDSVTISTSNPGSGMAACLRIDKKAIAR
jgi:hypothetical protein